MGVGISRTQGHWGVEKDSVSAVNVVCRNTVATEEAPVAVERRGYGINPRKPDQIVSLVKIGVIHGDVRRVGGVLVYVGEAAIAEIDVIPRRPGSKQVVRAVILGSTDRKIRIRGMNRDTHELSRPKCTIIKTSPGGAGIC